MATVLCVTAVLALLCGSIYADSLYIVENEIIDIDDKEWSDDSLWSTYIIDTFENHRVITKCVKATCLCQYSYHHAKYPCFFEDIESNSAKSSSNINIYDDDYDKYYDEYYDELPVYADDIIQHHELQGLSEEFTKQGGIIHIKLPNFKAPDPYAEDIYSPQPMIWNTYVDKYNSGQLTITPQEMTRLGRVFIKRQHLTENVIPDTIKKLRVVTKDLFLQNAVPDYNTADGKKCYENMGSDTYVSDFDFSYVRWDTPEKEIDYFIKFTNTFETIYGANSPDVFDMNFYIVTAFINAACLTTIHDKRSMHLFSPKGNMFEFIPFDRYDNRKFRQYDVYITYLLIQGRLNYIRGRPGVFHPVVDMIKRLKYGELFFYILNKINVDPSFPITDEVLLYLKTLKNFINYYSDESYVSNEALMLITFRNDKEQMKTLIKYNPQGIYIACLDNFVFLQGYFKQYAHNFLKFWNKASKYIMRIGYLLNMIQIPPIYEVVENEFIDGKDGSDGQAANLFHYAKLWNQENTDHENKKIRGDVALDEIAKFSEGAPGTPSDPLLRDAVKYWNAIKARFVRTAMCWADVFLPLEQLLNDLIRYSLSHRERGEIGERLLMLEANVDKIVDIKEKPLRIARPEDGQYRFENVWEIELVDQRPPTKGYRHVSYAPPRLASLVKPL